MQDIIFVSIGAVLGANFRFIIYEKFEQNKLISDFRILIINTVASFLLGFFLALIPRINSFNFSYQLGLFFSVGFLGSLSTFSTFVYDLFEFSLQLKFYRALKLFLISLPLGILALVIGVFWANQ